MAQVSALGYLKLNGSYTTTLGLFQKIESANDTPFMTGPPYTDNHSGLREKYKSLVRQLPSKDFIDKLLQTYFHDANFQYYPLDEGIFRDHLKNWNGLSFSTLNKGPQELPPDLQFFPAMLFQMLALALHFQPDEYDPSLDSLKYAAGMSFDDLATDYSESGVAILALLGKRNTTLVTVQAGFLRTLFLKNSGLIPESWHSLSQTIRDAQEIGLHKENSDSKPQPRNAEEVLENLWDMQLRRRIWLILSLWDVHMGLICGRPTTIDPRDPRPPFPIDASVPKNRREVAPAPRTDSDPPTPLTALLWNAEISAPLWDIYNLEKEYARPNDAARVERMHHLINKIPWHCPSFFREKDPDTSFDSNPDCYWLPGARLVFSNAAAFTIMALHRPYIFISENSRRAGLEASLDILRIQRDYFNLLQAKHYKMFNLVLNTFDAIILLAAIYILHPQENRDRADDTIQHFEWAMDRFETMIGRSATAKTALGVLKAINAKMKKALSQSQATVQSLPSPSHTTTPSTTSSTSSHTAATSPSNPTSVSRSESQYTLPTISNITSSNPIASAAWDNFNGPNNIPQTFDFSAMAPLLPMHDLLYKDLNTFTDLPMQSMPHTNLYDLNTAPEAAWQFEGDFGNDSFWGIMNNYNL